MLKIVKKISQYSKKNKQIILTVLVSSICVDVLVPYKSLDFITFFILFFYVTFIIILNIKSKFTFFLCLFLLSIMTIDYFITSASISTEKAAIWFILFLGIGSIQRWIE